jgi:hypothetical protein
VEGKITNHPIVILIDSGESQSCVAPDSIEIFHFNKSKNEKSWLIQLVIGTKRKINEVVKNISIDMD